MNNKEIIDSTIIGRADGPTSVYRADKKTLKQRIQQHMYKCKKRKAEKSIIPGTHTLKETIEYVSEKYDSEEVCEGVNYDCALESLRRTITYMNQEELLPDFHMYEITVDGGRMTLEVDFIHEFLGISWSGMKKEMKKIEKDIYMFYGVSEEDIVNKTQRYKHLVMTLSM